MADTREPPGEPAGAPPAEPPPPAAPPGRQSDAIPWSDQFLWPDHRWDAAEERGARDLSFMRAALAAVLVLAVVLLIWSSRAPPPDDLPADLHGRWTTPTPPFAGRSFVVSLREIGFDRGDGQVVHYQVRRVRHEQEGSRHRYRITYLAEGGEAELDLVHDPSARTLRLASRPAVIWRR